ncbi:hypothetical protein MYX84_11245 [Acidobacteria bacterium AH-259-O06]|nr:hypothetical protein [Acidobacteria bacterium AH-259-O06]
MIAEAGVNLLKDTFRGSDISTILAPTTAVPRYINYPEPTPGTDASTYFSRNPLAPLEAMNVDFENLPQQIGTRTVNGFLTPAEGVPFGTGGRYWAKTTDNEDGDSDMTADTDKKIYLRVLGIQRNSGGQVSIYGGNVKNSIAIIEATFKRDRTFEMDTGFTIYGPDVVQSGSGIFGGDSFDMDGYDHAGWSTPAVLAAHTHASGTGSAGIEVLWDNPGGGDATVTKTTVYDALDPAQKPRVIGPESDYTGAGEPSLRDNTANLRNDPDPDAQNIFDPNYIANFINKVSQFADYSYPDGTELSGPSTVLGTETDPKITVAEGSLKLSGNGTGAGLLIIKGHFHFGGSYTYRGLVLVIGEGTLETVGSNKGIIGGLVVAKLVDNLDGTYSYGIPQVTVAGNANFYYSSDFSVATNGLPVKTIVWREITRGLEPAY